MTQADATLHIGDVAERVGLSLRSVRYYEEQGLVQPEGRTTGGFRLYGQAQIDRLLAIMQMKPLGFTLEEMRELLDARAVLANPQAAAAERAAARSRLTELVDYAEVRIQKLKRSAAAGEELVEQLRLDTA